MILKKSYIVYVMMGMVLILLPYLIFAKVNVDKQYQNYSVTENRIDTKTGNNTLSNDLKILAVSQNIKQNQYTADIQIYAPEEINVSATDWYLYEWYNAPNQGTMLVNGGKGTLLKEGKNTIHLTISIDKMGSKKYYLVYITHVKNKYLINRLT